MSFMHSDKRRASALLFLLAFLFFQAIEFDFAHFKA